MATKAGDAFVELSLDDKKMQRGMQQAKGRFSGFAKGLGVAAAAAGAVIGAKLVSGMVRAFAEQEKVEMQLKATLKVMGQEVDKLFPKYMALAGAIQDTTGAGDEATLGIIKMFTQMGVASDQMEFATKAAIGLGRTFDGLAGDRGAVAVARAIMGDTQALERYIPAIKNAEGATAKMAATQKAMADAFAIAEESSGSSSVQLEALKGRIGDLGQAIVSAATGGEGFGEGLRKIADWVKDITPKVAKFVSILRILGTSVVMRIRIGFRNLGAVFSKFGSFIGGGTKGIEGFVQAINFAINRISKWGAILSDVLTGEWDKIEEDAKAFDDQLRTSTDEITELFKDKVKVEVDTPEGKPIKLLPPGGEDGEGDKPDEKQEPEKPELSVVSLAQAIQKAQEGQKTKAGFNMIADKIGKEIEEQRKQTKILEQIYAAFGNQGVFV